MIRHRELRPSFFSRHLIARRHARSRTKRNLVAGLMLTSMVDMFSLLVIFLLQSFSNSPEVMALAKDVRLPTALSASAAIDAPVLTMSQAQLLLDQRALGTAREVVQDPARLAKPLAELRARWQKSHPDAEFRGEINLQADTGLPSTLVSRVMNVLNGNGYTAVHLAVVGSASR